jgi:hypothetical protein
MKALRYLALVISLFALSSSLVFSQSLAEVAKKEKERRKQNKAEAKTVITDRELSSGRRLPSATTGSTQSAPAEGEQASDAAAGEAAEGGEQAEEEQVDETKTREYWQNRVTATKEKIAKLEQQLNSNDWGEGQRVGVDPRGMNNLARRQETEQQLAAAQTELAAIREEARRAGVPAGWTR